MTGCKVKDICVILLQTSESDTISLTGPAEGMVTDTFDPTSSISGLAESIGDSDRLTIGMLEGYRAIFIFDNSTRQMSQQLFCNTSCLVKLLQHMLIML